MFWQSANRSLIFLWEGGSTSNICIAYRLSFKLTQARSPFADTLVSEYQHPEVGSVVGLTKVRHHITEASDV
jgi:hypothetical protein